MRPWLLTVVSLVAWTACQENSISSTNADPTVTITSHIDGDKVVEAFPFTVRASAGDPDHRPEDLETTWYVGGDLVAACNKLPVSEDGTVSCEVTMYTNTDPSRVSVEVRDPRGGSGFNQVDLEVVPAQEGVDAPHVEIVEPADGSLVPGGEAVIFEGEVSDPQDPPTALQIEWTSNVDGQLSTQGADSSGTTLFVHPGLSSGPHVITLKATDTDGNFTTTVATIDVDAPPTAPVVSISPNPAPSASDLQASIDVASVDPEGASISYTYEWLKDGVPQAGQTSSLVLATNTARGQTWTVRVHPNDGTTTGPFGEASVTILNSAPVMQSVSLTPDPAYTNTLLTATPTWTDADGDAVTVTFDWQVNGVSNGQSGPTLDGVLWFDRGDLVQVIATPNDGSLNGASLGSNVVVVQNSAPTQPVVAITPATPDAGVDLVCGITTGSTDADGDAITYDFSWDVDGLAYPRVGDLGPFQTVWPDDTVDGADTAIGETWTCSVAATDAVGLSGVEGTDSVYVTFVPDYDGLFDIVPNIQYSCAFGLVNINLTQSTFAVSAGQLLISGAPTLMYQNPAPVDENFAASGDIVGACVETYTMAGTFDTNDHFSGTFSVSFNGWGCGGSGCTNQNWPVEGFRL